MKATALCPFPLHALVWEAPREPMVTAILKATYRLVPNGEMTLADAQDPLAPDRFLRDDPRAPLLAPTDRVPYKRKVDVLFAGYAYAPSGGAGFQARLDVAGFSKVLYVTGNRVWVSGVPELGQRVDPAPPAAWPSLGPVSPHVRASQLRLDRAGFEWAYQLSGPAPRGFDDRFFNAAPPDQQIDALPMSAVIRLLHLHPRVPVFETRLPAIRPRAFVIAQGKAPREIPMVCDTLFIDAERAVASLSFRGVVKVEDRSAESVAAVVESREDPQAMSRLHALVGGAAAAKSEEPSGTSDIDLSKMGVPSTPFQREAQRGGAPSAYAVSSGPVTPSAPSGTLDIDVRSIGGAPPAAADEGAGMTMDVQVFTSSPHATPFRQESPFAVETRLPPVASQTSPRTEEPGGTMDIDTALLLRQNVPFARGAAAPAPLAPASITSPSITSPSITSPSITAAPPLPAASEGYGPPPPPPDFLGGSPNAAPAPEEPKAPPVPEGVLPMDRYVVMAAELALRKPLPSVLGDHKVSDDVFRASQRHWKEVADKGEVFAFDRAFVAALERIRPQGPFTAADYATIATAMERGQGASLIPRYKLVPPDLMRVQRVWERRVASDPALAEEVNKAMEAART